MLNGFSLELKVDVLLTFIISLLVSKILKGGAFEKSPRILKTIFWTDTA